ncbi:MAG: MarR family winged helix-turn-helix transcriptional regulator [Candidatus Dormibacteria bacterium]
MRDDKAEVGPSRADLTKEFAALQWELSRRVKETVANELGRHAMHLSAAVTSMTPHQREAVLMLAQEGPLPMGELARRLLITPSSATELVDRLVDRALVERIPDPSDRRTVVIQLTPFAQERTEEVRGAVQIGLGQLLAVLDDQQLATMVSLLRVLAHSAQQVRGEIGHRRHGSDSAQETP